MKQSDIISLVQRRLGFRKDLANVILSELQAAQIRLEAGVTVPTGGIFFPWFLQTEINSIYTVVGEERILLPEDFICEIEGDALYVYDGNADPGCQWIPLRKDDLAFNRKAAPGTGDKPSVYTIDGTYFRILPVPSAVSRLKLLFMGRDAVLTDADSENKWLKWAPFLLMGEAGRETGYSSRDKDAMLYFENMAQKEVGRLWAMTEAREHANRSYVMGGED